MVDRYPKAEQVGLYTLIPLRYLRTIPRELRDLPGGCSEKSIVIEVTQEFAKMLKVNVPRFGRFDGFIRMNEAMRAYDGYDPKTRKYMGKLRSIGLYEATKVFYLVLEHHNGEETAFSVQKSEVEELLNTCLLAPEHRLTKS